MPVATIFMQGLDPSAWILLGVGVTSFSFFILNAAADWMVSRQRRMMMKQTESRRNHQMIDCKTMTPQQATPKKRKALKP